MTRAAGAERPRLVAPLLSGSYPAFSGSRRAVWAPLRGGALLPAIKLKSHPPLMKRLLLMAPLLLGLLPHLAYGQRKNTPLETTVRGRVTDAQSGAPLPGVNVYTQVNGEKYGTVTGPASEPFPAPNWPVSRPVAKTAWPPILKARNITWTAAYGTTQNTWTRPFFFRSTASCFSTWRAWWS